MEIRHLARDEVSRLWAIDRRETIDSIYRHERSGLVLTREHHNVRGWPEGEPEEYEPLLLDCFDHGGSFLGAFEAAELVGAAVLESRFIGRENDRLQLKFLHVSQGLRGAGLGCELFARVVERGRELGARRLYVSATPSENTVEFYLRRGCELAAELDPALFALEPEDIHLELALGLDLQRVSEHALEGRTEQV